MDEHPESIAHFLDLRIARYERKRNTSFHHLPQELLDTITTYLPEVMVVASVPITLGSHKPDHRSMGAIQNFKALRATSKKLKDKAEAMFFTQNAFEVHPIWTPRRPQGNERCPKTMHSYILAKVTSLTVKLLPSCLDSVVPIFVPLRQESGTWKCGFLDGDYSDDRCCYPWAMVWSKLGSFEFSRAVRDLLGRKPQNSSLSVRDLEAIRKTLEKIGNRGRRMYTMDEDWKRVVYRQSGTGMRCCGCDGWSCCRCARDNCMY